MPSIIHDAARGTAQQIPAPELPLTYIESSDIAAIAALAREIVNATKGTVRRKAMKIVELSEAKP
jgi:hypothetical protein